MVEFCTECGKPLSLERRLRGHHTCKRCHKLKEEKKKNV